ncbi:RNA recognition motif domain-containing protein [Ditylenchus destructor]|uniref:RNA recognition motif domain-containing protein n=1 Tax=Ditylenchus destructor TaxID=166010 RepID=A0AAD4NAW7_9BILA|nr:RNA recognition motif domain-containing protein [Ditylenchus destructor]
MDESTHESNSSGTIEKRKGVPLERWDVEYTKLICDEKKRISVETVKNAIRSAFEDDMVHQWRITLKCLLSGQRIKVPTRYVDCIHMECFDLEPFLRMKTQKNFLTCPICQRGVENALDGLRIDKYFANVLISLPDALQVELRHDGSFTEVQEESDVIAIDDEESHLSDNNTSALEEGELSSTDNDECITLSDEEEYIPPNKKPALELEKTNSRMRRQLQQEPTIPSKFASRLVVSGIREEEETKVRCMLEHNFQHIGTIKGLKFVKNRFTKKFNGVVHVIFAKDTCVEEAMRENPHTIGGYRCTVRRALNKGDGNEDPDIYSHSTVAAIPSNVSARLVISGIRERDVTKVRGMLRCYFQRFGKIAGIKLIKNRSTKKFNGVAHVIFAKETSLGDALRENPHMIAGYTCTVRRAWNKRDGVQEPDIYSNSMVATTPSKFAKRLFVSGICERDVTKAKQLLVQHFQRFGKIVGLKLVDNRSTKMFNGIAHVTFAKETSLREVLRVNSHMIAGLRCTVRRALNKKDGNQEPDIYSQHSQHHPDLQTPQISGINWPSVTMRYVHNAHVLPLTCESAHNIHFNVNVSSYGPSMSMTEPSNDNNERMTMGDGEGITAISAKSTSDTEQTHSDKDHQLQPDVLEKTSADENEYISPSRKPTSEQTHSPEDRQIQMLKPLSDDLLCRAFTFLDRKQLTLLSSGSQKVNLLIQQEFQSTAPYLMLKSLSYNNSAAIRLSYQAEEKAGWKISDQQNLLAIITKFKYLRAHDTTIAFSSPISAAELIDFLASISHVWTGQNLCLRGQEIKCSWKLFDLISTSCGQLHLNFPGSLAVLGQPFLKDIGYENIRIVGMYDPNLEFPYASNIAEIMLTSDANLKKNLNISTFCNSPSRKHSAQIIEAIKEKFFSMTELVNFYIQWRTHVINFHRDSTPETTVINHPQTGQRLLCKVYATSFYLRTLAANEELDHS